MSQSEISLTAPEEVKYVPTNDSTDPVHKRESIKKSDTVYLFLSIATCSMLIMVGGMFVVWVSPAIVVLKSNNTEINPLGRPVTTLETSMLTGFSFLPGLIGSFTLPSLADKLGRKNSLLVMCLAMALGVVGLAFSNNIPWMVTFGSLLNFCFAGILGIVPMYITEISEDDKRAQYGCFMSGHIPLGMLLTYILGSLFSLKYFTLMLAIPLIPFLVFFYFASESPVYSLSTGRTQECIETLKKLRSNKSKDEIDNDLNKLKKTLYSSKDEKKSNYLTIFKSKEGRIGMLMAFVPLLVQYWSGVPIILSLLAPIIEESEIHMSGDTASVIVGIFQIFCFISTSMVIKKTGRKLMLLLSSLGACLSLLLLGSFFYLKNTNSPITSVIQWLPIVSVVSLVCSYSIGLGPIPVSIVSEFFPADVRSSAVSIAFGSSGVALTLSNFLYPLAADAFGTHWCMWVFGVICFGGFIFFYFFLPETKGKSIHEIQEILKSI